MRLVSLEPSTLCCLMWLMGSSSFLHPQTVKLAAKQASLSQDSRLTDKPQAEIYCPFRKNTPSRSEVSNVTSVLSQTRPLLGNKSVIQLRNYRRAKKAPPHGYFPALYGDAGTVCRYIVRAGLRVGAWNSIRSPSVLGDQLSYHTTLDRGCVFYRLVRYGSACSRRMRNTTSQLSIN